MSASEGAFDRVDVREKWSDEARDFTPWLADNLDFLGNEIGLNLGLVQMEKAVGTMSLDILAEELDTGVKVAIENQLEWSDSDHLVRLLMYAAGCDAKAVILVAPEFVYEHANTLHWLNQCSRDEVSFYGVKVEVVRKSDDAELEARFRKVVYPCGWDKDATLPLNPPMSPDRQRHYDFYKPMIDGLIRKGFADRVVQAWSYRGRRFIAPFDKDSGYAVYLDPGSAWVSLHIRTWGSIDQSNQIFDKLLTQRDEIEASIDIGPESEWKWERWDKNSFFSVDVRRDGTIDDPPEKLDETRAWMLDLLIQFKEVFDPRMAAILERQSSP